MMMQLPADLESQLLAEINETGKKPAEVVRGRDLIRLIELANSAMRNPIPGVALRLSSPHDLDAPYGEDPLPPGVRRINLVLDIPGKVRLVFWIITLRHGATFRFDVERLLAWVNRIEGSLGTAHSIASDLARRDIAAVITKDPAEAQAFAQELRDMLAAVTGVTGEVRNEVADPATWMPIGPQDPTVAVVTFHVPPDDQAHDTKGLH
jgi:hypothetical protein